MGGKNSKEPEVADRPIPTPSEALDQLHELRRYVEGQANISDSLYKLLIGFTSLHCYKESAQQDSWKFQFFSKNVNRVGYTVLNTYTYSNTCTTFM